MTASIFEKLAVLPSGEPGGALSGDELGTYLRATLDQDADKQRNERHRLRDELYRDGGCAYMKGVIAKVFRDPDVIRLRQDWVEFARFTNPLKRIVNEVSTVYAEPARRSVTTDEPYQAALDAIRIDEVMFQVGRLLNLHRALLVGFRVRTRADGEREPVIDVATPANVRAVLHPNDPSEVVAWLVKAGHAPARKGSDAPAWNLWTEHERLGLRADMSPIGASYLEHGLGVCPWVPVLLGPPSAGFWPGEEGEDLTAAAVSIWLSSVFLLKESKSATKQSVIQGDATNAARGQAADSEVPIELGDGTAISTVDMSMDLGAFRDTANHILEHVAQNYGMSASLINHQGVQSAEARELMRIPLRELRKQQQVPLRRFEQRLALVMSKVLARDLPALAFSPDGWRIEFDQSQTPLGRNEAIDVFMKERSAGIDNTVDFIARVRPGMGEAQAQLAMERNIQIETLRNELMRPLQQISGAMGAVQPGADEGDPDDNDAQDTTAPQMFGSSAPTDEKE